MGLLALPQEVKTEKTGHEMVMHIGGASGAHELDATLHHPWPVFSCASEKVELSSRFVVYFPRFIPGGNFGGIFAGTLFFTGGTDWK